MTKQEAREKYARVRAEMPMETRVFRSISMCRMLCMWDLLCESYGICSYMSFGEEVTLLRLPELMQDTGVPFAYPRVEGDQMDFYEYRADTEFHRSSFGILEPDGTKPVAWEKAAVLVPGVAFDLSGGRIGYGKGYYDRYLSAHPDLTRIGIAFTEQVSEEPLPTDESDVKMHYLVLPDRIMKI